MTHGSRRWFSIAACGLVPTSVAVSSCGSRASGGPGTLEREGVLVLKGSEPHTHWVLVVSDTEQWALAGLNEATARPLQTRRIGVKGQRRPDIRSTSLLPTLAVIEFRVLKN